MSVKRFTKIIVILIALDLSLGLLLFIDFKRTPVGLSSEVGGIGLEQVQEQVVAPSSQAVSSIPDEPLQEGIVPTKFVE